MSEYTDQINTPKEDVESKSSTQYQSLLKNESYDMVKASVRSERPKNFFHRLITPMKAGSLRGCVLSLATTMIGMSCLNYPMRMANTGILTFIIFLLISFWITLWALTTLSKGAIATNSTDYPKILTSLYAYWVEILLRCVILLQNISGCALGVVSSLNLLQSDIAYFFPHSQFFVINFDHNERLLCFLLFMTIAWCCFFREFTSLRYASLAGIILVLLTVLLLIAETPLFMESDVYPHNYKIVTFENTINGYFLWGTAFTTTIYGYECHTAAVLIQYELKHTSYKRIKKIYTIALVIVLIIYLLMSITGYLSCGESAPPLIITRNQFGSHDYLMKILTFLWTFYLLYCIPIRTIIMKKTFVVMIKADYNIKNNIIISSGLVIFIVLLAVVFQNITGYINIIGSFFGILICVTFPAAIYAKIAPPNENRIKFWCIMIGVAFLTILGQACALLTAFPSLRNQNGKKYFVMTNIQHIQRLLK